jgi:hypothetical protein
MKNSGCARLTPRRKVIAPFVNDYPYCPQKFLSPDDGILPDMQNRKNGVYELKEKMNHGEGA